METELGDLIKDFLYDRVVFEPNSGVTPYTLYYRLSIYRCRI